MPNVPTIHSSKSCARCGGPLTVVWETTDHRAVRTCIQGCTDAGVSDAPWELDTGGNRLGKPLEPKDEDAA